MGDQATVESSSSGRAHFFVWMAGVCVIFVFAGFTPTYFAPLAAGSLGEISPAVHIHGLLFFSWTLFLLMQTLLVAHGRTAIHRNAGLGGISLATAMIIFGLIVSLLANERRIRAGDLERAYALGFGSVVAMITFGTMVALAIRYTRRPDHHKRLMLFATCMLLNAPVARFYRPMFNPAPPPPWLVFATIDVILAACLIHDWRTLRRPHVVTLAAGSVLLASQVLRFRIPETEIWRSTYDVLLRLVA